MRYNLFRFPDCIRLDRHYTPFLSPIFEYPVRAVFVGSADGQCIEAVSGSLLSEAASDAELRYNCSAEPAFTDPDGDIKLITDQKFDFAISVTGKGTSGPDRTIYFGVKEV